VLISIFAGKGRRLVTHRCFFWAPNGAYSTPIYPVGGATQQSPRCGTCTLQHNRRPARALPIEKRAREKWYSVSREPIERLGSTFSVDHPILHHSEVTTRTEFEGEMERLALSSSDDTTSSAGCPLTVMLDSISQEGGEQAEGSGLRKPERWPVGLVGGRIVTPPLR